MIERVNAATRLSLAVLILLLAAAIRLDHVMYGINDVCLTPPEEFWLWDSPQVSSVYSWDVQPVVDVVPIDARVRTAATSNDSWALLRVLGALAGLITVALTVRLALDLDSTWWILAGLFAAVAPPLVANDRWLVRFDFAALAVAVSAVTLLRLRRNPANYRLAWVTTISALSLLLIAPPLWWLVLGLLLLQPGLRWSRVAVILFVAITIFPALRSPAHWIPAALSWDSGATAACVWLALALILWRWPRLSILSQVGLAGVAAGAAIISLAAVSGLPQPNTDQEVLITWLQQRIPDGASVRFDSATWPLVPAVACPKDKNIRLDAEANVLNTPWMPGVRPEPPPPDFIVTTDEQAVHNLPFVTKVDDIYYVARLMKVGNPVDIGFGDLLYLLNYEIAAPTVKPGDMVNIRLDYQFTPTVTVDALRYAAFIQVAPVDDPSNVIVNYNASLVEESGNFGPRRIVINDHHRLTIPLGTPPGKYKVTFGLYNIYNGERLKWSGGDTLTIGKVQVGG